MSFVNAKGSLGGSNTIGQDNRGQQGTNGSNSGSSKPPFSASGSTGAARATWSNVTTPANSALVIVVASATAVSFTTSSKSWNLKRGTTTIANFSLPATQDGSEVCGMYVYVDTTPTAGTHTYKLEDVDTQGFGGIRANLLWIDSTDTHNAAPNGVIRS